MSYDLRVARNRPLTLEIEEYSGREHGVRAYLIFGACWLIGKTEGELQQWAFRCARRLLPFVVANVVLVCLWMPYAVPEIWKNCRRVQCGRLKNAARCGVKSLSMRSNLFFMTRPPG